LKYSTRTKSSDIALGLPEVAKVQIISDNDGIADFSVSTGRQSGVGYTVRKAVLFEDSAPSEFPRQNSELSPSLVTSQDTFFLLWT